MLNKNQCTVLSPSVIKMGETLNPPFEDIHPDSVVWRRKMLYMQRKAKIQETNTTPLTFWNLSSPQGAGEAWISQAPWEDKLPFQQPVSTKSDGVMWLAFHFRCFYFLPFLFPRCFGSALSFPTSNTKKEMLSGVFNYIQPVFNSLYQRHLKYWCFPGKV